MKILVVDDSKAMRMILARTLREIERFAGATILEACDGHEALTAIDTERPDLVLSDWNMPEMTGIALLETLNERRIPVDFGFVTSESTPEMHDRAMAAGARFLVSKPFTAASLVRAINV